MMKAVLASLAVLLALPLAACATGKSEVPDCVKRFTGDDDGCHTGALGATTLVHGVNKTAAGMTIGAVTATGGALTAYDNAAWDVLYAPWAIVGGVFTGVTDGVGHVPATQNCHYNFGASLGYAWSRDYRCGTADAQVPEHRSDQWNGGAYWPGGPR